MTEQQTREAILELMPCDAAFNGRCDCIPWRHQYNCARAIAEWLLKELAKPHEERRDYYGRPL